MREDPDPIRRTGPGPSERGSEALLGRAQAGEPEAVDALVEQHLDDLRAFVRLHLDPRLRARESASDIVQSACRNVLEGLNDFEFRGEASFRAWLFTAALNKVREKGRLHRAQRRDVAREVRPPVPREEESFVVEPYARLCSREASPSQIAIAREQGDVIEAAIDGLPADQRQVLLLARVVGLSHGEIAERIGRTTKAVDSLVNRATLKLLATLEGRL